MIESRSKRRPRQVRFAFKADLVGTTASGAKLPFAGMCAYGTERTCHIGGLRSPFNPERTKRGSFVAIRRVGPTVRREMWALGLAVYIR